MRNKGITGKRVGVVLVLLAVVITVWQLVGCAMQIRTRWIVNGIYWNIVLYEVMILVEGYLILWLISDKKYRKFRQDIALYELMEKNEYSV